MTVKSATGARELIDQSPATTESFKEAVLEGFQNDPPTVPCKFLYDERGSHLFDRICETEEYYSTRTEMEVMREYDGEMAAKVGDDVLLAEYGSGSSLKTRILLDAMGGQLAGYVPLDISREHLRQAAGEIAEEYPDLWVQPVCADYTQPVRLPEPERSSARRVVYFPGSTIGNFAPADAQDFLARIVDTVGEGGGLLMGVDLQKDKQVIHAAYNDETGVTAAFNKNLIRRLNRELDAGLDYNAFAHRAPYNEEQGFVEMRLVCRKEQEAEIDGQTFSFESGDFIRTERSHKYTLNSFNEMAETAGLERKAYWTDDQDYFSIQYFEVG